MNAEEMTAVMREFDMKSPIANKELSEADELLYNQRYVPTYVYFRYRPLCINKKNY